MATPYAPLGTSGTGALIAALLIGIAFGWFLERSGLGSARKLSAQFRLTDMAVLKVMFAAIVTAMLGVFWLGRLGVVDVSRIYVPETWLVPQLVGGAIFGIGLVVCGLCPGTSCVSAATGRLDGLAVVLGMLGGVWLFAEVYPWLAPMVESTARGTLTLDRVVGVPSGAMVFAVVLAALGAFVLAERIERRRNA